MIQRIKKIKKSTIVLVALFVLNVVVFSVVSTGIKKHSKATVTMTTNNDNNTYFKSGVNVLDWSYTLLRYFRK